MKGCSQLLINDHVFERVPKSHKTREALFKWVIFPDRCADIGMSQTHSNLTHVCCYIQLTFKVCNQMQTCPLETQITVGSGCLMN